MSKNQERRRKNVRLAGRLSLKTDCWAVQKSAIKQLFAITIFVLWSTSMMAADRMVERIVHDLNGDAENDFITLTIPETWDDPGEFTKIEVSLGKKVNFVFSSEDGWVSFSQKKWAGDGSQYFSPSMRSILLSKRVALIETARDERFLLLFGNVFSDGGIVTVLKISEFTVAKVFEKNIVIENIADINSDGKVDLVGSYLSEEYSENCEFYNPLDVYSLNTEFDPNPSLKEKVNRKIDGFYAKDSTKYLVLTNSYGKKILIPASESGRCVPYRFK